MEIMVIVIIIRMTLTQVDIVPMINTLQDLQVILSVAAAIMISIRIILPQDIQEVFHLNRDLLEVTIMTEGMMVKTAITEADILLNVESIVMTDIDFLIQFNNEARPDLVAPLHFISF